MHEIKQAGVTAKITGGVPQPTRIVPPKSKRGAMNALSPNLVDLPSRALSHLDRELNRRTSAGTAIPDGAALFTTGEVVLVKGEAFRVKSLDPKRLVLEGVKAPAREPPIPFTSTWTSELDGSPITATMMAFLDQNGEPVTSEVDRYDVGQRLTLSGTEYVVTGRVLVLAPVESEQPIEPSSLPL